MGNRCLSGSEEINMLLSKDQNSLRNVVPLNYLNSSAVAAKPTTKLMSYSVSKHTQEKSTIKEGTPVSDIWSGHIQNGKKSGLGVFHTKTGLIYEGSFENDYLTGMGKLYCTKTGSSYEGEFLNNKFNGIGTFLWKDGTRYHGSWADDLQNGYGEENNPDGSRYEGHFFQGHKHGKGIQHFGSGEVYIGEFSKDRLHGWGEYRWPDGKQYFGGWYKGLMNGKGELAVPTRNKKGEKSIKRGVWAMGKLVAIEDTLN